MSQSTSDPGSDRLESALRDCTVRITVATTRAPEIGSGFFVAPGLVLTCAHVVELAHDKGGAITVEWDNSSYPGVLEAYGPNPYPDLALVRINLTEHPCVLLHDGVKLGDEIYSFGYPPDYPHGDSALFTYEGPAWETSGSEFLKLKAGQATAGFSGAPLLNRTTKVVCGVLKRSRDVASALGGRGIPTSTVLAWAADLERLQSDYHRSHTAWTETAKQLQKRDRYLLREIFVRLIGNRTEVFGGRQTAVAALNHFLADPSGRYCLVTARAGFGKTALLANLVSLKPDDFAYHFFAPQDVDDSVRESFFLRSVLQQMAQWRGEALELGTAADLGDLRALFAARAAEPYDPPRTLVLDGLDEVTGWKPLQYMDRSLPPGLRVILSVRDVGQQDIAADYQLPEPKLVRLTLGGLTRDDVVELLRGAGGHAATLADDWSVVNQICRVAAYEPDPSLGADPFYVRFLVEDVQKPTFNAAVLAWQPSGLAAYLDTWWQGMKAVAGERAVQDLFGTLAASPGPIGRADLESTNPTLAADMSGWSTDTFETVLSDVRHFILQDVSGAYALAHPRLREYVQTKINVQHFQSKLLDYCLDWRSHRSSYALNFYVRLLMEAKRVRSVYETVLDREFQVAQLEVLGDPSSILADLRRAMALAVEKRDVVELLAIVGAYRRAGGRGARDEHAPDAKATLAPSAAVNAIFAAIDRGDVLAAHQLAEAYSATPDWGRVAHLYLAWEAAERNQAAIATAAVNAALGMPVTQSTRLSDALVARTARVLGAQGADGRSAAAWLQAFGINGQRNLLEEFRLTEIVDQAAAQQALDQVHTQLGYLERAFNTGDDPEAVSAIEFIDAEREGTQVQTLTEAMLTAVGVPEGRAAIQRVTEVVSRNAYPRYRDLALVSAGVASVAAPDADSPWARAQIRRILMAVLGREGITFTFDLASTLVAEADRRSVNVPPDLREYLERGASENDIWGTAMRAWNGRALARLHTGRAQEAFGVLLEAAQQRTGFVGFSTVALLALINRCIEVGSREAAAHPIWPVAQALNLGQVIHMQPSPQREKLTELLAALKELQEEIGVQARDLLHTFAAPAEPKNLFEAAVAAAANVRDPDFRLARIELVLNYVTRWRSPTPDPEAAGALVAELHDQDSQLAYVDQVSARWTTEQGAAAWDGIAALLPVALGDGTTLDALLARLVGPRLRSLDDQNLARAMATCLSDLSGGHPWQVWPAGANPATVGLA